MEKEIKALRKVLNKASKNNDGWEEGTVIRWIASYRYSYAAIKTPVGWYTTASVAARNFVPQVVTYDELIEILAKSETTDVDVATEWAEI